VPESEADIDDEHSNQTTLSQAILLDGPPLQNTPLEEKTQVPCRPFYKARTRCGKYLFFVYIVLSLIVIKDITFHS
jgi:hypothetical protein